MNSTELFHACPRVIDPLQYGVDLSNAVPLDNAESRVFVTPVPVPIESGGTGFRKDRQNRRSVLKVYDTDLAGTITVRTVEQYQYLTRRAGEILSNQPGTLKIGNGKLPFHWQVVPIDRVGALRKHPEIACSLSEYIPGERLSDLIEGESAPLREHKLVVQGVLFRVSEGLNRRLRTRAVFLSTWNTKWMQEAGGETTLIITDVCAQVSALNR